MKKKPVYTFQQDLKRRLRNPKFREAWEEEILKDFEEGKFKSVKNQKKTAMRYRQYARFTLNKK